MPLPPRKESMDEFVTWLVSNGAKFEKVKRILLFPLRVDPLLLLCNRLKLWSVLGLWVSG